MKIDLHNFFKYYDEKNPKHVGVAMLGIIAAFGAYAIYGQIIPGIW